MIFKLSNQKQHKAGFSITIFVFDIILKKRHHSNEKKTYFFIEEEGGAQG